MIWAVVAFGDSRRRFLRPLKSGFRHCSIAIHTEVGWVGVEPLLQQLRIGWVPTHPDTSAPELCRQVIAKEGMTAAVACIVPPAPERVRLPLPMTCVEVVKHALGLRRPLLMTPWQLWRHLNSSELVVYVAER